VDTTTAHAFEPFAKIPRLRRGLVITEKIDGTNAQIYFPDDGGPMLVGSRNRWITPGKSTDNHGFAQWAYDNEEQLRLLGLGRHYGEWWGPGIGPRKYNVTGKTFSLFNVGRWTGEGVTLPPCVSLVPTLYAGPWTDKAIDDSLSLLREHGSRAAPGTMNPEGIIVFHVASRSLFKVTLDKDEEHKGPQTEAA
jgi:hypothetical protein